MKKSSYATVQVRRDSPAFVAAQEAATGASGQTVNSILRRGLDRFFEVRPLVEEAMLAMVEALKEPAGGSYEPVRAILTRNGIYNDDLDGERCLLRLAQLVEREVK